MFCLSSSFFITSLLLQPNKPRLPSNSAFSPLLALKFLTKTLSFLVVSTPGLDWNGSKKTAAVVTDPHSTTRCGDNSYTREAPLEGPSRYIWCCVLAQSFGCSLFRWRKVVLPLVLWQESGPNFKGLPNVSGVTTNHWVFLRCDWSLVSSWFYYRSRVKKNGIFPNLMWMTKNRDSKVQKFSYVWGSCYAPHNVCPNTVLRFDKNLNFWKLAVKTWFWHWLPGLCMHGGFKVWLLNGCGPSLCFPKAFKKSAEFLRWKSGDKSPYFHSGN